MGDLPLYCYNVPGGGCDHLLFRCVSRLLYLATRHPPSTIVEVVKYRPAYDDTFHAMYESSTLNPKPET